MEKETSISLPPYTFKDAIINLVAGGMAGIAFDFLFFPLCSIKTRLQASSKTVNYAHKAKNVSLFSGLLSVMTISFPGNGTFFSDSKIIQQGKADFEDRHHGSWHPSVHHFLASAGAELTFIAMRCPFEVVKQNMQIGTFKYTSEAIRQIYKYRGIRGFYIGVDSMILNDVPLIILMMMTYEAVKKIQIKLKPNLSPLDYALTGIISGVISGGLTNPIDVIKTKLVTYSILEPMPSITSVARQIWKQQAVRGFWRGMMMRMVIFGAGSAGYFAVYEGVRGQLFKRFKQ